MTKNTRLSAGRDRVRAGTIMAIAAIGIACAGSVPPQSGSAAAPAPDCTRPLRDGFGGGTHDAVRWLHHASLTDRSTLDEWCRGVGAPVVAGEARDGVIGLDSLAVISWNVHLGEARLDAFIAALRGGELTGQPMEHFVLLAQEVRRNGGGVPAALPDNGRGARRLGRPDASAEADIVATAERLGLQLFYAPSMRNGRGDDPAEDRGNAILTTLPLTELTAIELPLLAQRRVAVAATIPVVDPHGRSRSLRVASVHLDYGASRDHLLAPFGPGRTRQAGALVEALDGHFNTVVGGDFNTWSLPRLEGGLTLMQQGFPDFPASAGLPTHYTAGLWPRQLDHLFLRAADVTGSAPVRLDERWGSDHYPLLAWIHFRD